MHLGQMYGKEQMDRVFSPKTVFSNWTGGLTVKAGPAKQPLVREHKKNCPAGKKKEGKEKNIKEATALFTSGPALCLDLFSQQQT